MLQLGGNSKSRAKGTHGRTVDDGREPPDEVKVKHFQCDVKKAKLSV